MGSTAKQNGGPAQCGCKMLVPSLSVLLRPKPNSKTKQTGLSNEEWRLDYQCQYQHQCQQTVSTRMTMRAALGNDGIEELGRWWSKKPGQQSVQRPKLLAS